MSVVSTFGLTVTGGIGLQVCVKDEKDARAIHSLMQRSRRVDLPFTSTALVPNGRLET
jgi:hypothetical protein